MRLFRDSVIKFDDCLPIYNWYYPLVNRPPRSLGSRSAVFERFDMSRVRSRAFYFHVPFCESICSFCPFVRTTVREDEVVELYTRALIREIEIKARYRTVSQVPVGAIFFGGGTPGILSPEQIRRIGRAIRDNYDLSLLSEFSFEMAAKSIGQDKLEAMREIGVTHPRFGVQTFNAKYRSLFALSTSLDDVHEAARILPQMFPHPSFDMLYGMNGETEEEFTTDVECAASLGIRNVDFYPINNLVTQVRLHEAFARAGLEPTSGLTKFYMNILLREAMKGYGFLPHNGHGYVRVPETELNMDPVVTDRYSFRYHEYVYGYSDEELIGFGTNAISSLSRYYLVNTASRNRYIRRLLDEDAWDFTVGEHGREIDAARPVITRLPYHGDLDRSRVEWDLVPRETSEALSRVVEAGLVSETEDKYELTQEGWYWYVNLIYYLSPREEQLALSAFIEKQRMEPGRKVETSGIAPDHASSPVPASMLTAT